MKNLQKHTGLFDGEGVGLCVGPCSVGVTVGGIESVGLAVGLTSVGLVVG